MNKNNADNLTIGKNGKAYYGKGTNGGMAPQPKTPNENIKEVNIDSSKQIPNQNNTTGIGVVVAGTGRSLDKYVAFNDAYNILLDSYSFKEYNIEKIKNVEQQLQNAELSLNKFKKALNKIGYMDEQDPIITSKVEYEFMIFFVGESELFKFNLITGNIEYDRDYGFSSSRWGEKNFSIGNHQAVISRLKSSLDRITTEIAKQGFKIETNHIKTIIQLGIIKDEIKLVGYQIDWIPYVCAGVSKDKLCEILKKENNPDYNKNYMAVSVETALKLNSIHPSFSKQLLE